MWITRVWNPLFEALQGNSRVRSNGGADAEADEEVGLAPQMERDARLPGPPELPVSGQDGKLRLCAWGTHNAVFHIVVAHLVDAARSEQDIAVQGEILSVP